MDETWQVNQKFGIGLGIMKDKPSLSSIVFWADSEPSNTEEFDDKLTDLMFKYRVVSLQASINLYPKRLDDEN